MRVFLTGASGFIGAHVTRALIAKGHSVKALVLPGDSLWRLQDVSGCFGIVECRLNDTERLREALSESKPDACIHLAWYAEPDSYLNSMENISCLNDSLSLLHELIKVGCKQVVMAGTCAEYNTDYGYLREDTPTNPVTLYSAAKLSCFLLCQQIAVLSKISFAWGRIFFPFGPQEDERRVVPALIRSVLQNRPFPATTGEQIRDYIYVEDVADAFCIMAESRANGVFNISSGVPVTIRFLLEAIEQIMNRTGMVQFGAKPHRAWEPHFICGDHQFLKKHGWKPKYTLTQGLSKTIQWWLSNRKFNI